MTRGAGLTILSLTVSFSVSLGVTGNSVGQTSHKTVTTFNKDVAPIIQARSPIAIPKGSRIEVTAHFDNSSRNKYNPEPKALLRWGDSTRDEMMSCVTYYYVDSERLQTTEPATLGHTRK
jgi:hypothetical protein